MRNLLSVCAMVTLVAACSSDKTAVGPDLQACTVGSIAAGDTKTGALDAGSCATYDWYWWGDSTHYASYNVTVEKGNGYLFTLDGSENDGPMDKTLALVSRDAVYGGDSVAFYLAAESPNDAGEPAQIFFVAPQTGTYSLRAFTSGLDDELHYTLTARDCEPRAVDIAGAFEDTAATLSDDDCTLREPYFNYAFRDAWGVVPSHVALYTVHFDGYAEREISVVSHDFQPAFMIEGPGFDAWCNMSYCDGRSVQNQNLVDSVATNVRVWMPGTYTVAVGSMTENATGEFSLRISEPYDPNAATLMLPRPATALQPGQWKRAIPIR